MQVYIKNKKDREKWQYLLKLEIGFAKIKEWFLNSKNCPKVSSYKSSKSTNSKKYQKIYINRQAHRRNPAI